MSRHNATAARTRRSRGTGSLFIRIDTSGRETYYGQWWAGGKLIKRRLGPVRPKGSREGLTKTEAEKALRKMMAEVSAVDVAPATRVGVQEAGDALVAVVEGVRGRKSTTVQDYRIVIRKHLVPFFTGPLSKITPADVERYAVAKGKTLAPKTVSNHLVLLGSIFRLAVKRGWATSNPVELAERPRQGRTDPDIEFLTPEEIDALLRAVPDDAEGPRDRALYATAAWAGLRQGELAGLRWRDVDWTAGVIRVRQTFTRGQFSTPKSAGSARAVPMFDRLAGGLDRLHKVSAYTGDDDLVFCHPHTGHAFDSSHSRRRFHAALTAAGLRRIRFHDLRHTYGTQMAAAGCPLRTLQHFMGHARYATTEVYAHFAPDPTRGAAWAEAAFGGEVGLRTAEMRP